MTTVFDMAAIDPNEPIPDGMVWNMRYRDGRAKAPPVRVTDEEIWDRLSFFLKELMPVAIGKLDRGERIIDPPDSPKWD